MAAPLSLQRSAQLLVSLSRAEASLLEKQDLGTVDGAAALRVLSGGVKQYVVTFSSSAISVVRRGQSSQ